jgi:GT2 family glycosyltransferase
MFFSIIIPTCNRNDFLSKCLDLLAPGVQTFDADQYHVIVTDDGKNGPAQQMIKEDYPWAQWIAGPCKGPSANRNNGAKLAKADWLIFLDDDCLPATTILETYKRYIIDNPSVEVYEGRVERLNNRKSILEYAPGNNYGGNLWSANFAILASVFNEVGGFDENFKYAHLEDTDLKERIEATGRKIFFAYEAKVQHPWRRINGKSLGRNEEMSMYYSSKYGESYSLMNYVKRIIGGHLGMLKRTFFSREIFPAIKITSQHLGIVLLNYHKWKKKYPKQPLPEKI